MNDLNQSLQPTISACLIVKNEAHHLVSCLESIKEIAHEIVVVDTGSTDNTIQIAKAYTNKVISAPWNDHYSEARNLGLAHATGDYILVIDADEILPETTAYQLQSYLSRSDLQGKPWVLNWRVCSDNHVDLYSRGVFPNGYGIQFSGRVHEVPVLLGQNLPSYNCSDLILRHNSRGNHDQKKLAYYQGLLLQELKETTDACRINHLQKHLGLTYLALSEWHKAWKTLRACHAGMRKLKISPQDGYYADVLRGLVQVGQYLKSDLLGSYLDELYKRNLHIAWKKPVLKLRPLAKGAILFSLSINLLSACQPGSPVTNQPTRSNQTPILLLEDQQLQGVNQKSTLNLHKPLWGDFRIQEFCEGTAIGAGYACYASGGEPIPGPKITLLDGTRCLTFDYCQLPEPTPTPTPDPTPIPTPIPTPDPNSPGGGGSSDCEEFLFPDQFSNINQQAGQSFQSSDATRNQNISLITDKYKEIQKTQKKLANKGFVVQKFNEEEFIQRIFELKQEILSLENQMYQSEEQQNQELTAIFNQLGGHISDEFMFSFSELNSSLGSISDYEIYIEYLDFLFNSLVETDNLSEVAKALVVIKAENDLKVKIQKKYLSSLSLSGDNQGIVKQYEQLIKVVSKKINKHLKDIIQTTERIKAKNLINMQNILEHLSNSKKDATIIGLAVLIQQGIIDPDTGKLIEADNFTIQANNPKADLEQALKKAQDLWELSLKNPQVAHEVANNLSQRLTPHLINTTLSQANNAMGRPLTDDDISLVSDLLTEAVGAFVPTSLNDLEDTIMTEGLNKLFKSPERVRRFYELMKKVKNDPRAKKLMQKHFPSMYKWLQAMEDDLRLAQIAAGKLTKMCISTKCYDIKYFNPRLDLVPTHRIDRNSTNYSQVKWAIERHGNKIVDPVKYVIGSDGRRYVVDGHHRLAVAREMMINNVPAIEVQLPWAGYSTEADFSMF